MAASDADDRRADSPDEGADGEQLSHVDAKGEARMVDVGSKQPTLRRARAEGIVRMAAATRERIQSGDEPKGSVLGAAGLAGIQAAKRTGNLIPLCHPLQLDHVQVDFEWLDDSPDGAPSGEARLRVEAEASVTSRTGVEMEALTAVSIAALTVYDMAKAIDRAMVIEGIRLLEKTGGKTDWRAP